MSSISPRHLGGSASNFLATSDVNTSRHALKTDLLDKIVNGDLNVFKRLSIDKVDDAFVSSCAASFYEKNQKYIQILRDVADEASGKSNEELEKAELDNKLNDPDKGKSKKNHNHGSVEELKMYDPLV
jgi:hypothetical protein